jgi:hypothetical protein
MDIWLDVPTPVEAVLPRRVVIPTDRALVLGRTPAADFVTTSVHVDRRHCEIGRDGCGAWICNSMSGAGTYVNNRKIGRGQRHRLLVNDVIRVGDVRIRVGWDFESVPDWLDWESGVVVSLAVRVRDESDSTAMPILADALEDVGCSEAGILHHLRGPGPHLRECWIIDAILKGTIF